MPRGRRGLQRGYRGRGRGRARTPPPTAEEFRAQVADWERWAHGFEPALPPHLRIAHLHQRPVTLEVAMAGNFRTRPLETEDMRTICQLHRLIRPRRNTEFGRRETIEALTSALRQRFGDNGGVDFPGLTRRDIARARDDQGEPLHDDQRDHGDSEELSEPLRNGATNSEEQSSSTVAPGSTSPDEPLRNRATESEQQSSSTLERESYSPVAQKESSDDSSYHEDEEDYD
ncbi:uncharacterized protein K452DRAFT_313631 [Aplosporella prunicola CBS 121167]|uniref:Uncharacterized protein n=1 Tax=Aplosporella prunicola CBS 121167 TaxID=1176127 RepID=A0A6A6AY48_9PEZI|nr:uncharacterized protein K452DRAFT_313631 [Aplosporella prunicola CBS 121167]KAF2135884.1 hypothetical protein K452DRAFT_313631 [Aplosporella prunicola CBS 121167]